MSSEIGWLLLGSMGVTLFGVAVLVAARMISGPRDFSRDDSLDLTLTVVGWVLIIGGILAALLILFNLVGLVLLIAVLAVAAETLAKNRLSRQHALLWLLTVAAERLIPLVPAVEALAREGGGPFANRVRHLANMLGKGVPLPDALQRLPGLLPRDVLPVIRVGYESGALAAALRQVASARDFRRPLWQALAGRLVYLMVLVAFGISVVIFAVYMLVPSFQKVFGAFDVQLPPMTRLLVSVSQAVMHGWYLLVPFLVPIGLLFLYVLLRYVGLIHWELPGTNWLVRRLDTAAILETLALAAEHRRPLPETLATLARSYHKASIRGRLRGVARDLDRGTDWCESLFARGLIQQADRAILQAAQRAGNLPWALREMADSNRRRLAYRLYTLVQLLFPPCVLVLAAAATFIVVSLFVPVISLIERMVRL
ncbi:MAG: type II secretion system F family protein [Planctomycetota bacterium]|jgi:type II secretory pathway component PulF